MKDKATKIRRTFSQLLGPAQHPTDARVKKLLTKWEQSGERDRDRLKLVKKEYHELSLEAQKAIAGVMRIFKQLKRLPPGTKFGA
jgi:hypothetical protein